MTITLFETDRNIFFDTS